VLTPTEARDARDGPKAGISYLAEGTSAYRSGEGRGSARDVWEAGASSAWTSVGYSSALTRKQTVCLPPPAAVTLNCSGRQVIAQSAPGFRSWRCVCQHSCRWGPVVEGRGG